MDDNDLEYFMEEVAREIEEVERQKRGQKKQEIYSALWYPKFLSDTSWKNLPLCKKKNILSQIFPVFETVDQKILLRRLRDISFKMRTVTRKTFSPRSEIRISNMDFDFTRKIPVYFYRYPEISCIVSPDDLYHHLDQIKDIQKELSEEARIRLFFRHSELIDWKDKIQERYARYIEGYDPEKDLRCKLIDCSLKVATRKEDPGALFFTARDMFSYAINSGENIELYACTFFPECINNKPCFCEMMWYIEDYRNARPIRCTKNRGVDCRGCYEKLKSAPLLKLWSILDIHPVLYRCYDDGSKELTETHPAALFFRIAGWFNQFLNVFHHLICRSCHSTMTFDLKYCTAYYNAINLQTVAECENPVCPDYHKKVYLSTCWNCHEIIDSLQDHENDFSKRDNGYWYCNYCGAGSKEHKNEVGEICPKCLASLRDVYWIRNMKRCPKCRHVIHKY